MCVSPSRSQHLSLVIIPPLPRLGALTWSYHCLFIRCGGGGQGRWGGGEWSTLIKKKKCLIIPRLYSHYVQHTYNVKPHIAIRTYSDTTSPPPCVVQAAVAGQASYVGAKHALHGFFNSYRQVRRKETIAASHHPPSPCRISWPILPT